MLTCRFLYSIVAGFFVAPWLSHANDLGVYSRVWPIDEVNLKQTIAGQLQAIDRQKIGVSLKSQVENLDARLQPQVLPLAKENSVTYFDPSVSLPHDIRVSGRIIYKKGTWVNPLNWVRPKQDMLFFDGRDAAQLDFALAALKRFPYRLMPVMTAGKPIALSEKIHRPVYYANSALIQRFRIREVPTLLGVGDQAHRDELSVVSFVPPYSVDLIERCWHGLRKFKQVYDAVSIVSPSCAISTACATRCGG